MADVAKQGGAKQGGIGGFFARAPEFVRQVRAEAKKIVWPSRRETVTTAILVVILTVILGIFFFGVDTAFNGIVRGLLKLAARS